MRSRGKLLLLDRMLQHIKIQGLRVLILSQSGGGSGNPMGDILDDFVRQRFGYESYERVERGLLLQKKQTAMNMFNDWNPMNDLRALQKLWSFYQNYSISKVELSTEPGNAAISQAYLRGSFYSRAIVVAGESEGISSVDGDLPKFCAYWLCLPNSE
ncbi:unnamed protein product [Miscanthus lutarioriparius]|uniref:Uncharacterized protein n=1 Tax=Miscanthus lutarioriparius TaxID=422564 RepID=A0A811NNP5_9POAL|nr:unnamed protein product [Miscanthus lutarioriparius]